MNAPHLAALLTLLLLLAATPAHASSPGDSIPPPRDSVPSTKDSIGQAWSFRPDRIMRRVFGDETPVSLDLEMIRGGSNGGRLIFSVEVIRVLVLTPVTFAVVRDPATGRTATSINWLPVVPFYLLGSIGGDSWTMIVSLFFFSFAIWPINPTIQIPLTSWFRITGAFRTDIFPRGDNSSVSWIQSSVGVGLSLGPVRIEARYVVPVNRGPFGEREKYLSIVVGAEL